MRELNKRLRRAIRGRPGDPDQEEAAELANAKWREEQDRIAFQRWVAKQFDKAKLTTCAACGSPAYISKWKKFRCGCGCV